MMNATENLNAVGLLVQERKQNRNLHATSIMQLCRSAMEASARTIWLLGDPDRNVRRDRRRRRLPVLGDHTDALPDPPRRARRRNAARHHSLTDARIAPAFHG
jgi:hypothetical protein